MCSRIWDTGRERESSSERIMEKLEDKTKKRTNKQTKMQRLSYDEPGDKLMQGFYADALWLHENDFKVELLLKLLVISQLAV